MLALYQKEKRELTEMLERNKQFYTGPVEKSKHTPYNYNEDETKLIPNPHYDPSFCGYTYWLKTCEDLYRYLDERYEPYFPKEPLKGTFKWIGINPYEQGQGSIKDLFKKLQKLKFENYMCNVEAHTENGYRPHIHMIYLGNIRPVRIIEKLSKHFGCGKNFIEISSLNIKYLDEKKKYIKGEKTESKMEYVLKDKEEREKNNIPDFIENL